MAKLTKSFGWANFVLALYLILSPAIFTFEKGALFTVIFSIALAILCYIAVKKPVVIGVTWAYLILAALMFFSPWIVGFTNGAAWNMRIVTIVMVILSGWALKASE